MKNFAVVGVGNYADNYIKTIQKLERENIANLFCVVIRDRDKYAERAAELDKDGVVVYTSFEKMLMYGKGKIDIIALPIASPDHFEYAAQALAEDYDIIVEKPAAITIQEVDELLRVQLKTDNYCIVANEFLYSTSINLLCNEITSGKIGKIKKIRALCGWPAGSKHYERNSWTGKMLTDNKKWSLDGPATNYCAAILANAIYLLRTTCAPENGIQSVQAELYRAYDIASYDTACLRVKMEDGAEIFFAGSYAVENQILPIMELECENATVSWNFEDEKTIIRFTNGRKKIFRERNLEQKFESIFREAITLTSSRSRTPTSTVQNARSHVLTVNLAFESAQEIVTVPPEFIGSSKNKQHPKVYIKNLNETLLTAYQQGKLFSETGVEWARPTQPVPANGYHAFPNAASLKNLLK
jgi:predicted dehydrogenase